jgi:hypothetical protein
MAFFLHTQHINDSRSVFAIVVVPPWVTDFVFVQHRSKLVDDLVDHRHILGIGLVGM